MFQLERYTRQIAAARSKFASSRTVFTASHARDVYLIHHDRPFCQHCIADVML